MSKHDDFYILATLDDNDHSMNNEKVKQRLETYLPTLRVTWGKSTSKIHAVNRDMPTDWDIVIATSDDMEFIMPGFDLQIIKDMQENFPDKDGILHYKDGFDHGDILSLPVIGRAYYNRFGYIYHPSYQSLFCDEEAIIVAKALGKLYSSPVEIVKHNHPANIGGHIDAQLQQTQKLHPLDKRTFEGRKRRNFFMPVK